MKKIILFLSIVFLSFQAAQSQDWLTSFDAAKRLALVQDKMILMIWEDATQYPFPVMLEDSSGSEVVVENLFEAEYLNKWIWTHFVPVVVSETYYAEFFEKIKGKRNLRYMNKFNDDSIKIMDINGNILNIGYVFDEFLNLSKLIRKYYINTSFLKGELLNYSNEKNFRNAYYLAKKYIDATIYLNKSVRPEAIGLSTIYLEEAKQLFLAGNMNNKNALEQKLQLLEIYQDLVLNKPRKVLRQLNKIELSEIDTTNEAMHAFLYLTAHRLLKDENKAKPWRSKVSLVNLKKANDIITNAQ